MCSPLAGFGWVASGVHFLQLRPALLPEDPRFIGASDEMLRAAPPGPERWLNLVFNVRGGFMIAGGSLTALVACRYVAIRARGTLAAIVVAGTASVGLMSATNFIWHSDFRWLLLVPALLWLIGVVSYLREGIPEQATGVN